MDVYFEYDRAQQVELDTGVARCPECLQTLADMAASHQLCAFCFFYFVPAKVETALISTDSSEQEAR